MIFSALLRAEFRKRQLANSHYSIRAFARQLKVDSSHLSKVIRGQARVSSRYVEWAGQNLCWSDSIISRAKLMSDVTQGRAGRRPRISPERAFTALGASETQIASTWLHYVVMELTQVRGFKATIGNISKRLVKEPGQVLSVITDLVELGAIAESERGVYRATRQFSSVKIPGTSTGLKKMQREILSAAAQAMDRFPENIRDQSGIVMACDPSKIPEAKKRIKKFRRDLMALLESGEKTKVYQLSISLFPAEAK